MWELNAKGEKEFVAGKNDWEQAAAAAEKCSFFRTDVDEELVADRETSCYNCRYRRWTAESFTCLKAGAVK